MQILNIDGDVIFDDPAAKTIKNAVYAATQDGVSLHGADLSGADLSHIYLAGADLSGTELFRTNLSCATLDDVKLDGAMLSEANLSMTCGPHFFQIAGIGSARRMTTYCPEMDRVWCGCVGDYKGVSLEEFENLVVREYDIDDQHGRAYMAAIVAFRTWREIYHED